jgi:hypothetical protein
MKYLLTFAVILATSLAMAEDAPRIWLGMTRSGPSHLVVNWETGIAAKGVLSYGATEACERQIESAAATRHEVEVPFPAGGKDLFYRIRTGERTTPAYRVRSLDTKTLRVAIVGDWQGKPDLSALLADKPQLLITAGDNVPRLWTAKRKGDTANLDPYRQLVDRYRELFRTVPVLPALGNHDREILPRGNKRYPPQPTYDPAATAFRAFFSLPGDEWKWHLDVPGVGLRLIALDLNHTSDFGTTWQTCHPFDKASDQYRWYQGLVADPEPSFIVTVQNEQNVAMRGRAGGIWPKLYTQGSAVVTGFGYFAERAEVDGFPYLNTSLNGRGAQYKDPKGVFLAGEDTYVLLTVAADPATAFLEIKSLAGKILDRRPLSPRRRP